ncbi:hypothetical protein ACVBGC_03875 [Burkholderia stagnalis]
MEPTLFRAASRSETDVIRSTLSGVIRDDVWPRSPSLVFTVAEIGLDSFRRISWSAERWFSALRVRLYAGIPDFQAMRSIHGVSMAPFGRTRSAVPDFSLQQFLEYIHIVSGRTGYVAR